MKEIQEAMGDGVKSKKGWVVGVWANKALMCVKV
jgi:hypothetical protein